jgi:hypothetical protein
VATVPKSQSNALTRSTQTAFFIRWISALPSAFSLIYNCRFCPRLVICPNEIVCTGGVAYLAKYAKERNPEDEQDQVPNWYDGKSDDERNKVKKRRQGG